MQSLLNFYELKMYSYYFKMDITYYYIQMVTFLQYIHISLINRYINTMYTYILLAFITQRFPRISLLGLSWVAFPRLVYLANIWRLLAKPSDRYTWTIIVTCSALEDCRLMWRYCKRNGQYTCTSDPITDLCWPGK